MIGTTQESIDYKLHNYTLNPDHPEGGPKSVWFRDALGFDRNNAGELAKQLVFDPASATITVTTRFGTKYNQIIYVNGANGKVIPVKVAWIRNSDGVVRIVSVVPTKKGK